LNKKRAYPKYLKELLQKYPKIASGRKNFDRHEKRILKTIKLIKEYCLKINN